MHTWYHRWREQVALAHTIWNPMISFQCTTLGLHSNFERSPVGNGLPRAHTRAHRHTNLYVGPTF